MQEASLRLLTQETSERHTSNGKYENFVTIYKEAIAKYIPTKPNQKPNIELPGS